MRIVDFSSSLAQPVTRFDSVGATSVPLGDGQGESHVYCVRLAAGGSIGEHVANFPQLFLVVEGSGWVSGADGVRRTLHAGQGAVLERGETHAKGSDGGMTAIMVQIAELAAR